jgi:hypothetical protein
MNEATARMYIKVLLDHAVALRQRGQLAIEAIINAETFVRGIMPEANQLSSATRSKLAAHIMQHVPKPRSA